MTALNVLPGKLDITVFRGASLRASGALATADDAGVETPINLTGYTARLRVYRDFTTRVTVHEANTTNGQIQLGASDGRLTIDIPSGDVAAMGVTAGEYDLFLFDATGAAIPLAAGAFKVTDRA